MRRMLELSGGSPLRDKKFFLTLKKAEDPRLGRKGDVASAFLRHEPN